MKVELANGQVIAYDRTGVSGIPIVLMHGLSGYRESYASTIEHLHEQIESGSFQVFAVDLRGHGESSWATLDTYDAVSYSQDIALFIETVVGRPAVVVGHSLGGVVSATLAQHRPDLVCATLLEDPPLNEGDPVRRNASPVAAIFPKVVAGIRALQARNAPSSDYALFIPPGEIDFERRCQKLQHWDPSTMEAAADGIVWKDFNPVGQVVCPVTIVRADPALDAVCWPEDATAFVRSNPHAVVIEIPGAGHLVRATQPDAYFAALDAFLANVS